MRFTLQNKVLLPVTLMIVVTIGAALFIVNQVVRRQALHIVSAEVQQKLKIFDSLQQSRIELLAERARVVANTPTLRAAIETGHPETVAGVARQLYPSLEGHLLMIFDQEYKVLATLGSDSLHTHAALIDSFESRTTAFGTRVGLLHNSGRYYEAALAPVIIPDRFSGLYMPGHILLGRQIDEKFLENLDRSIGGHFLFLPRGQAAVHSPAIRPDDHPEINRTILETRELRLGEIGVISNKGGEFLIGAPAVQPSPNAGFLLVSPVERLFQNIISPIERTILLVGAMALLASILISGYISHQVVAPVQHLVKATDAVSEGDYDQHIEIGSQDEIGVLARKFDSMRLSLKRQMTELAARNRALESALQQLEKTQLELVQSEKLAATGKITAQLSHELNNPIHNIRSSLEAALHKLATGRDPSELLTLAQDEAVRMGRLVQQMLDFYRPQPLEKERLALNHVLTAVLKICDSQLSKGGIRVESFLQPDLPDICGAADQLKQVFLNIITNAADAMPEGGILRIRTRHTETMVETEFEDTGIGIDEENLGSIFDAFYTTKSRASGVGLGLSVSYGIVRSHGGKIIVRSRKGQGATFIVQLPRSPSEMRT